jgi:hypothetical protein
MDRIQLKSIKFSEWNSQETNCFEADIFFDGKKVGYCRNDGHGGNTDCYCSGHGKLYDKMEDYCKTLPDNENYIGSPSLENVVDELFESWLKKQNWKKIEKDFSKGVCVGTENFYKVFEVLLNGKRTKIEDLLKTEQGSKYLRNLCKQKREEGLNILNTNLPF